MNREQYDALTTGQVAQLVQETGPHVCVFPVNGTRRWFILENDVNPSDDWLAEYRDIAGKRHVELYAMLFEHGIHTLLTPIYGPDIAQRGDAYMDEIVIQGIRHLITHPDFVEFYEQRDVRVRFYGDYRDQLPKDLVEEMAQITERTRDHDTHRLFYGICAGDPTASIARIALRTGSTDKDVIVKAYYGEPVDPVDVFIGFGPFSAFDMPLLTTGFEALYFMVSPSPYLDAPTLRSILYDFAYERREPDYGQLQAHDWELMDRFYRLNRHVVLGTGTTNRAGVWFPSSGPHYPPDSCRRLVE